VWENGRQSTDRRQSVSLPVYSVPRRPLYLIPFLTNVGCVYGFQFKPVIRRRDALLDAMLFTPVAIPSVRRGSVRTADRPLANSDPCPLDGTHCAKFVAEWKFFYFSVCHFVHRNESTTCVSFSLIFFLNGFCINLVFSSPTELQKLFFHRVVGCEPACQIFFCNETYKKVTKKDLSAYLFG